TFSHRMVEKSPPSHRAENGTVSVMRGIRGQAVRIVMAFAASRSVWSAPELAPAGGAVGNNSASKLGRTPYASRDSVAFVLRCALSRPFLSRLHHAFESPAPASQSRF